METFIAVLVLVLVIGAGLLYYEQHRRKARRRELDDARADARRWTERLGGQVFNLVGTDGPSEQALADASERYTAAGAEIERAHTAAQCRLARHTALEGLYYVRAARTAMGMDPGPELPSVTGQAGAGEVTEGRAVEVEGHDYLASPHPGERTPYYYPGGRVAGRPVPRGWYSEQWWRPALVAGAWGMGSMLLFSTMFAGMAGVPSAEGWEQGLDAGQEDAMADMGGGMGDGGGPDMGGGMDIGGM